MNEKIVMFIRKIKLILLLRFMVGGSESGTGRLRIGIISSVLIVLGSLTVGTIAYAKMGHDEQIIKFEEKAKEIPVAGPIICYYFQAIGLGDKDNDGILDINDKWPNLYNFPAQKYAEELGLSEEIVKELAPLNMHNGKPEITEKAKEFIDYLAKLPPDAQKYFVKAASDGKITNQELKLMKYPFGTNEFEDVYVFYLYDKYNVRNPKLDLEYKDIATKKAIEYYVGIQKIPREDLYLLIGGVEDTSSNITKVLLDIAKRSDEKDLVLISFNAHGSENGAGGITYKLFDKYLDRIKSKNIIIVINACQSGAAIPYLKEKNRTIITASRADEFPRTFINLEGISPEEVGHFYKQADRNHDGVVTLKELYLFKKEESEQHPQIYDPNNISNKIYLGLAIEGYYLY